MAYAAQEDFTGKIKLHTKTIASNDNILSDFAALVGRETVLIRKTSRKPPRVSVVDVISVITGKDANQALEELWSLVTRYRELRYLVARHFRFPGRGQHKTFVTKARGIVEVVMLLSGVHRARQRRQFLQNSFAN